MNVLSMKPSATPVTVGAGHVKFQATVGQRFNRFSGWSWRGGVFDDAATAENRAGVMVDSLLINAFSARNT